MNERQERIYDLIKELGSVSVEALCAAVYASPATVRRDLKAMELEGVLIRTWGGAMDIGEANNDPPASLRSNTNVSAKKAIAKTAAGFLRDNISVFLPSGTTVPELAKHMRRFRNLSVFTNGLDIVDALKNHPGSTVLTLGGIVYENYDTIGPLTDSAIECLNADLFFLSCSGICADGFTASDMVRLDIMKKMQKRSAKTILLVDTSKVGKRFTYRGFPFERINYVIMEKLPDDSALIEALGDKLIIPTTPL